MDAKTRTVLTLGALAAATAAMPVGELVGKREVLIDQMEAYRQSRKGIQRKPVGYRKCYTYKPNGAKERARRMAKINAGEITEANGLI